MNNKEKVISFFDNLSFENIHLVDDFYAEDAEFIDPLISLKGVKEIENYYENLYKSVIGISFDYPNITEEEGQITLQWVMNLKATGIKSGKEIHVNGISLIKFHENQKVIYHRDYYDMGEFVYEHVPMLNKIIFYIKGKLTH